MARDVEIVAISSNLSAGALLPTTNPVLGSTADASTAASLQGWLKRTQYQNIAAASTWLLSTSAVIDRMTVIPGSSATGTVQLLDGTTAIMTIPTVAHLDAKPYTLHLGIRNTAAAGFKVITGNSVAVIVSGAFQATPTTA
jgi:hypothetical protein